MNIEYGWKGYGKLNLPKEKPIYKFNLNIFVFCRPQKIMGRAECKLFGKLPRKTTFVWREKILFSQQPRIQFSTKS